MEAAQSAQNRASQAYRERLEAAGKVRFEVQALAGDRELIRALARRLSHGTDATEVREILRRAVVEEPKRGTILAALRASPLVGANLDLGREVVAERELDL